MKLFLGVIDLPYVEQSPPGQKRRAVKAARVNKSGQPRKVSAREYMGRLKRAHGADSPVETTGDVASVLEAKYHVMEAFFASNIEAIGDQIAEAMMGSLENQALGGPEIGLGDAEEFIGQRFRDFIDNSEIERVGLPGVPTDAALKGVNSRMRDKMGGRRPSFRDTGLYAASFRSWFEGS